MNQVDRATQFQSIDASDSSILNRLQSLFVLAILATAKKE